jgi:aldehyde dehydrogenase (NAD+)
MNEFLKQLGLTDVNDGTWFGNESRADASAELIESINPATGELIASVRSSSAKEYEQVVAAAQKSFLIWRTLPAPVRGEAIRRIGNALRKYKDPLGSRCRSRWARSKPKATAKFRK